MTTVSKFSQTSDPRIRESRIGDITGVAPFSQLVESETQDQVSELTESIQTLVNQTGQLRLEIHARPNKWATQIWNVGDEDYKLTEPLPVLIEEYPGDEVIIARIPELEVFGEGVTDSEAIYNLKLSVLDLYDELMETDVELLGSLPRTWLQTLKQIIVKTNLNEVEEYHG
jgi:hypothetical protein